MSANGCQNEEVRVVATALRPYERAPVESNCATTR